MNASLGFHLDPRTLIFAAGVLSFLTASIAISTARAISSDQFGLKEWARAMVAAGCGLLLYAFCGDVETALTSVLANTLLLAGAFYSWRAHARLCRVDVSGKLGLAVASVGCVSLLLAQFGALRAELGQTVHSVAVGLLMGMTISMIRRHFSCRLMATRVSLAIYSILLIALAVHAISGIYAAHTAERGQVTYQLMVLAFAAVFVVAASFAFFALVSLRRRQEMLAASRKDGLTGLYTRAAFFEMAEAIASKASAQYSVVMVDLDFFKRVNDEYGHQSGDAVLAHAAQAIASSVRPTDFVGRYGGEEFCVFLNRCDWQQALAFSCRVVEAARIQKVPLPGGSELSYTLSAGVATSRSSAAEAERLRDVIGRADEALYHAKRSGRDRAAAAEELTAGKGPEASPSEVPEPCIERAE